MELVESALARERTHPEGALPPNRADLERLCRLLEDNRPFCVLEFGCGYSTVVMAAKLAEMRRRWEQLTDRPAVRNRHLFRLFTVDTSAQWLAGLQERFDPECFENVTFHQSRCEATLWNGQLCHLYTTLPDVVPEFVYLDGPDPADVEGAVHGLTFSDCPERTVMAADVLVMEPTLLPGCTILVDGRTNNARFLERNLQRPWVVEHDAEGDVTLLRLDEPSLGPVIATGWDARR